MHDIKEANVKNRTCYFFDDIINVESLNSNKIKIDEKSYKNILLCHIGYVTPKTLAAQHL